MTNRRALITFLLLVAPFVVLARAEDGASKKGFKVFDGMPKRIIVNGYSTSFHWPKILQRKLDRYLKGKRVLEVSSVTKGGTPIAKWIDPRTGEPLSPWIDRLRPGDGTRPSPPVTPGAT